MTRIPWNTKLVFMRNITVTLDDETARWARIEAAKREMSVSRFIRDTLRERMGGQALYDAAMQRYVSRQATPLRRDATPLPSREETHDRAGLR